MDDTRITDKLSWTSEVSSGTDFPNGTITWSIGPAQLTIPRMGFCKRIVSQRDGTFKPGAYRVNPVTISNISCSSVVGRITARGNSDNLPYWVAGNLESNDRRIGDYPLIEGSWSDTLASYSINKAQAKLKDADADVALMLAELRETLEMLKDPFKNLTEAFMKLTWATKPKRGQTVLDALTGSWLTYRYGILPLISDVNALIALYHKKLAQSEQMSMGRRKAGCSDKSVKTTDRLNVANGCRWTSRFVETVTTKSTCHLYYQQLLEADSVFKARMLGFHWTLLPAIFWETTTLSFVVDWAIAVGDWLRAIMPDTNLSMLGNSVSQKISVEQHAECVAPSPDVGYKNIVLQTSYWSLRSDILIRRVELATPVLPAFTPKVLNIKRTLDLLSLLWQPLSQKLRRAKYASKR